jgi:hypothetical protein
MAAGLIYLVRDMTDATALIAAHEAPIAKRGALQEEIGMSFQGILAAIPNWKYLFYIGLEAAFVGRLCLGLYSGRFSSLDGFERRIWITKKSSPPRYWLCALATVVGGVLWGWYGWHAFGLGGPQIIK